MNIVSAESPAPLRMKLLFWLILGTLSLTLSEVVSFTFPVPFLNPGGWLVPLPLYGLQVLVLSYLIFGARQVTIPTVYLAGAILGMYEAYLTKVLWLPTWGQEWSLVIGGVYMMHAMTLVVYWHPVMAFMLPVVIAESLFTSSGETLAALPRFLRGLLGTRIGAGLAAILLVAYFGVRQGLNSPDPVQSLRSGLVAVGVVFGLAMWWRRLTRQRQYAFRELLPTPRQARVLGVILALYYVGHFFIMRFDALPRTLVPHLTVWIMYALLIGLLILHVHRSPPVRMVAPVVASPFSPLAALLVGLLFPILSALTVALKLASPSFHHYLWKSIWYGEWAVGAMLALWTVASLMISPPQHRAPQSEVSAGGQTP